MRRGKPYIHVYRFIVIRSETWKTLVVELLYCSFGKVFLRRRVPASMLYFAADGVQRVKMPHSERS
jgi:hypothetical protein